MEDDRKFLSNFGQMAEMSQRKKQMWWMTQLMEMYQRGF